MTVGERASSYSINGCFTGTPTMLSHCANGGDYGGIEMGSFIGDLVGAIYDFLKFIFTSICYLVAGMLIVGVPLYLIALVFSLFH